MEEIKLKAERLIHEFKGEKYIFGLNCMNRIGNLAEKLGSRTILIISGNKWAHMVKEEIIKNLEKLNIRILAVADSVRPNSPSEDLYNLQDLIVRKNPEFIIAAGGGSTIDCAKAASVLSVFSPYNHDIDAYFGTGKVTEKIKKSNKKPIPLLAVQMTSSSAAHLTKYSNITNLITNQKKLIVDDAIIPEFALFDYAVTTSMNRDLTTDGVLDGISHCLETYYGASEENFERIEEIALTGIEMLLNNVQKVLNNPENLAYRENIGLGTDLGGYSIMVGGTNGAHLTSFSLIDILSHGRACGIMNPYYTVFFAPAIVRQLKKLAVLYKKYMGRSYLDKDVGNLSARELGEAVAKAMIDFLKNLGLPTKLNDVAGFGNEHLEKAIEAAKNPELEMKLKNMPVTLSSSLVDEYMLPLLEAAKSGDFTMIKNFA